MFVILLQSILNLNEVYSESSVVITPKIGLKRIGGRCKYYLIFKSRFELNRELRVNYDY